MLKLKLSYRTWAEEEGADMSVFIAEKYILESMDLKFISELTQVTNLCHAVFVTELSVTPVT